MKQISKFIEENKIIKRGDNIVLGLSGGADSVLLFEVLNEMKKEFDLSIVAVHVNHGIRETAVRDEEFVKKICEEKGIEIRVFHIDCVGIAKASGISAEEAGRNERYRLFKETGDEVFGNGNYKTAVAHHMDDLAETTLFNLARGTGINGLASIKVQNGNIVRPLLCVTKEEILSYLNDKNIEFVTDETNESDDYSRNKIRHNIIPVMNEICERATKHIAETANGLAEIENYLEDETNKVWNESVIKKEEKYLISDKVFTVHPAIKKRVIHKALKETSGRAKDISSVHIEAIINLYSLQVGKKRNLIYDITAVREYEGVSLFIAKETTKEDAKLCDLVLIEVKERDFSQNIPVSMYTKWFDYDKITNCPVVRFRQPGDFLYINESNDRKLLSDYMINEKIPGDKRDSIPLLADGNHILWVVGYRISSAVKISDKTTKIMEVKYQNEVK